MRTRFIVDANVGRLARWLRMMGYDALFYKDIDDNTLISIALKEKRVVLTKDTQIMKRRVVTSGRLKALLIDDDDPRAQARYVAETMGLNRRRELSLCLECNQPLVPRDRDEVRGLVPPYVFQTQARYLQCPSCHRIYWQGTHWQHMKSELEALERGVSE